MPSHEIKCHVIDTTTNLPEWNSCFERQRVLRFGLSYTETDHSDDRKIYGFHGSHLRRAQLSIGTTVSSSNAVRRITAYHVSGGNGPVQSSHYTMDPAPSWRARLDRGPSPRTSPWCRTRHSRGCCCASAL